MIYRVSSVTEFNKKINRNVYCFGAGKMFDYFLHKFSHFKLQNNIKAVVDNNVDKMNISFKTINNISISIISLTQMLDNIKEKDCILITTAAYEEIVQQLEKIPKLNFIEYYLYWIMEIEQYDYERLIINIPEQLAMYTEQQIPKIIHYCWFGKKKIPEQYKKWMESWKYYCSDYEIVEWNENNYDVYKNKYLAQSYELRKWAFVSDYARIDIINEYGGIYLDTDVEIIKNIDEMLMNDAYCGFESNQYVNYGLGFGAKKHHIIIKEIKNYYDNIEFILKDGTLNQINCPIIQTEIMKKQGLICNGEFQIVGGMTVYPSRILCGMSPHSFRIANDLSYTYAIHHFSGSWVDDNQGKIRFISNMKRWSKNDNYIYPCL